MVTDLKCNDVISADFVVGSNHHDYIEFLRVVLKSEAIWFRADLAIMWSKFQERGLNAIVRLTIAARLKHAEADGDWKELAHEPLGGGRGD